MIVLSGLFLNIYFLIIVSSCSFSQANRSFLEPMGTTALNSYVIIKCIAIQNFVGLYKLYPEGEKPVQNVSPPYCSCRSQCIFSCALCVVHEVGILTARAICQMVMQVS